jgi:hypothetical protein
MNYASAQALADTTLAAIRQSDEHGKDTPDAITTVYRTVYNGPKGKGWEVRVKLKGKVRDITIVRHVGGESQRNIPDRPFADIKAQAIRTLAAEPFRQLTLTRVKAATTIDELLFDAGQDVEEQMDALRLRCADHSQKRLDAFASSLGYDNITTLRSAALSSVPRFHAEGHAGQAAWDAEWSAAQAFIVAVQAGQVNPTFENYVTAMPASFTPPDYNAV